MRRCAVATASAGRHSRRAFTLVELLIVIGIIAVLVSILMPALSGARKQAQQVQCENNLRQIILATSMYVNESQGYLPWPNWGGPGSGVYEYGWLYDTKLTSFPPQPTDMQSGILYHYINEMTIYHCPLFDPGANVQGTNIITSYLMNGAACGYGGLATGMPTFKVTQIPDSSSRVLFWEADETSSSTGSVWNDGSSFPSEEQMSDRHNKGANVACLDFHVEWWPQNQFKLQAQGTTMNSVWWNILQSNGQ